MILDPFGWEDWARAFENRFELGLRRFDTQDLRLETEEDLVAFHAARQIAYFSGEIQNMAVRESKAFRQRISGDEMAIWEFLNNTLSIDSRIPWRLFVKYKPRDPHYALHNFKLHAGFVELPPRRLERFAEEVFRRKYLEVKRPWPEAKGLRQAKKIKAVEYRGDDPPCIQNLLAQLKNGENLPHMARWTLAVYLLHRGKSVDQIVDLFRTAPDFKERITRYYVEHAKKKGYKMPSCAKIKSYGLCPGDCGRSSPLARPRRPHKS